jgi:phospholipid-translocating ATPase
MPLPSGLRTELSISRRSGSRKRGSYAGTVTSAHSFEDEMGFTSKISPTFCTNHFLDCLKDKKTPTKIKDQTESPFKTQFEAIEQFLLNIVINHDVLIEKKTEKNDVIYQGVSPDEVTLVSAANEFGYTFISRQNNKIVIYVYDDEKNEEQMREFDVLQKFDFTSERQRSSIIVRDKLTNQIIIYIKGSDKKIFAGKNKFSAENIYEMSQKHVDQFARQGYRTLCYSFKYLDENDYNNWIQKYNDMKYRAINDKSLSKNLDLMIEEIEGNATILGVSALEDKLQDRVKEDIEDFIEAGINFWMITGDKMDTAETIGYSCGIISEDSEVYKIRDNKDVNEIIKELEGIKEKIYKADRELEQITEQHQEKIKKIRTMRTLKRLNPNMKDEDINKILDSKSNINNNKVQNINNYNNFNNNIINNSVNQ